MQLCVVLFHLHLVLIKMGKMFTLYELKTIQIMFSLIKSTNK